MVIATPSGFKMLNSQAKEFVLPGLRKETIPVKDETLVPKVRRNFDHFEKGPGKTEIPSILPPLDLPPKCEECGDYLAKCECEDVSRSRPPEEGEDVSRSQIEEPVSNIPSLFIAKTCRSLPPTLKEPGCWTAKEIEGYRVKIFTEFCDSTDWIRDSFFNAGNQNQNSLKRIFKESFERAVEVTKNEKEVKYVMDAYKSITSLQGSTSIPNPGEYPYDQGLIYSHFLFSSYLDSEGLKPEIYEDIPSIIREVMCDENLFKVFAWRSFYKALTRANKKFDIELHLLIIVEGGAERLAELAQFGIRDSRLEHAITTIQRLIRFKKSDPPKGENQSEYDRWIMEFEARHHQPRDDQEREFWRKKNIHLSSFAGVTGAYNDDDDECSIVHWNRKCIPEYICELIRSKGDAYSFELSVGVEAVIAKYSGSLTININDTLDGISFSLNALIADKKESIYKRQVNYLLDDDALAKIPILIRIYTEGGLRSWKSPKRDVLKFLCFTINDKNNVPQTKVSTRNKNSWVGTQQKFPTPSQNFKEVDITTSVGVAKCYLDRLDALPLHVIKEIFDVLDGSLAHSGRALLTDFSKIEVERLDDNGIRYWFNALVVDSIEDIASLLTLEAKTVKIFLKGRDVDLRVTEKFRAYLKTLKAKVIAGAVLYEYKIWNEPITVSSVTLAPRPDVRK
jgi:hypothetical protein